jgi:hypothetical protein
MESVSIKPVLNDPTVASAREREFSYFAQRWGEEIQRDRWLNPLVDPSDESLRTLRAE